MEPIYAVRSHKHQSLRSGDSTKAHPARRTRVSGEPSGVRDGGRGGLAGAVSQAVTPNLVSSPTQCDFCLPEGWAAAPQVGFQEAEAKTGVSIRDVYKGTFWARRRRGAQGEGQRGKTSGRSTREMETALATLWALGTESRLQSIWLGLPPPSGPGWELPQGRRKVGRPCRSVMDLSGAPRVK